MRRRISLSEMEAFAAVVREMNFSRAAEQCCTTQPALSVTIRELERKAGAALLLRSTRRMSLTPAGEQFHHLCKEVLALYDDGFSRFQNFVTGRSGTLVVAASPSIMAGMFPRLLQRFHEALPDVKVEVRERLHEECVRLLREKKAHCAITAAKRDAHDLEQRHLFFDKLILVFPTDHTLASRTQVTWEEIVRHPQVSLSADSHIRQVIEVEYAKRDLKFRPADEVERFTSLLALVSSRRGVGILPESLVRELSYRNLRFLPIAEESAARSICLITARASVLPPAFERFREVCVDVLG